MKYILIGIMILCVVQLHQLNTNEKINSAQVASKFSELESHAKSVLDQNEEGKQELLETIAKAEKTASEAADRNIVWTMVTFCVAMLGVFVIQKRKVEPAGTGQPM